MSATYELGETADLVVHVRGEVTAMSDDHITIAGHALPRQLGDGVVTLSTTWPQTEERQIIVDCDGGCEVDGDTVAVVVDAARRAHDDHHGPAWAHCDDPICAAVRVAS